MSFLTNITHPFQKRKIRKEQLQEIEERLMTAVSDGQITDDKLAGVDSFFNESALTAEEYQKVRCDVFAKIVYKAIEDRRVTDDELALLNNVIEKLAIPPEVERWANDKIGYFRWFSKIESGGELPVGTPSNLILQKDEKCHLSIPGSLIEERVVRSNYVGGSRGVSFKIAKGVRYRVGQNRGHIQSERGMVPVSEGYFIVTNQRIVFSGDKKSVETTFKKLIDLQVYSDAIQFAVSNRQKPVIVRFNTPEESELSALIVSRLINDE